jgi:hypothetical protein
MVKSKSNSPGYEQRDIHVKPIVSFAVIIIVFAAVMHLLLWWIFREFNAQAQRKDVPRTSVVLKDVLGPEPRLQIAPSSELQQVRKAEEEILNSFGWVDQQAGVARIPISLAIDLLVQKSNAPKKDTTVGGAQ